MRMVSVFARNGQGDIVLKEMRWGLIPASFNGHVSEWQASTSHACLETVATKPSFQNAWNKRRRVIFPMNNYSEKAKASHDLPGMSGGHARITITRSDDKPLGVAGIYDFAQTADGPVLSVAMLTRAPGPRMFSIHDREPVVVEPEDFERWLKGASLDLAIPWADDAFNVDIAA